MAGAGPRGGDARWISGKPARVYAHRLRARSQAICVGLGTVLADDPALNVRHVRGRDPAVVILDSALKLPTSARLLGLDRDAPVWVYYSRRVKAERVKRLREAGAEPVRVYASGGQSVNHLDETYDGEVPDILDNAYVIVDYDGGARAMLDLCMFAEGSRNEQEIAVTGDAGKVEAFVPESVVRIGRRSDGSVTEFEVADDRITYAGLHEGSSYLEHLDFLEAIRNGTPAKVTFEDGMRAVAIGVAAHRSIEDGRPVSWDEVMTPLTSHP